MLDQVLAANVTGLHVSAWLMLPFAILLSAIGLAPFIHRSWWEKYYPFVSIGLGLFVFAYYCFCLDYRRMAEIFVEYFSFIVLIGSLFVASGGIFLHTERHATPWMNTLLLAVGALVSNIIGTTGASMLLIRPFLRINRPRIRGFHIAFFIFIVSNIGGGLTPIGDPPLFLGYLNGVPFQWTLQKVWDIWLLALVLVLAVFFLVDTRSYRRWLLEKHRHVRGAGFELRGSHSFFFLFIILAAVFARTPVREVIMIIAAAAAHRFATKEALRANEFTFAPIREVAILFAGIFATMVPALDWLAQNAHRLGIRTPGQFFWSSGILSSFLDNAPTYLNFLSAAMGLHGLALGNLEHMTILLSRHAGFLRAISVGAVFFGATTYIGNGPNFMVKSIAEHAGVKCPSFFGYIFRYSLPVLIPIFVLIWLLFFR
jgi:Na+/H+ antiporter NhaD/arsenite permease-like protein